MSTAECGVGADSVSALLRELSAVLDAGLLGEADARDLAQGSGACSTVTWTRHELSITHRVTSHKVGSRRQRISDVSDALM